MLMFLISSRCAVYISFLFTIVLLLFFRNRYPPCLRYSRYSRYCRYATLLLLLYSATTVLLYLYYCVFLSYNICISTIIIYICVILRSLDFDRKRYSTLLRRVSKILPYPQYRITRVYLALALGVLHMHFFGSVQFCTKLPIKRSHI